MDNIPRIFLTVIACSLIFYCSNPTNSSKTGGGASETGNVAFISGYLYTTDGSPASGAKVCFVHYDNNPSTSSGIVDSTTTDTTGWFGIDSLVADTYNVYGIGVDGDLSMQGPLSLGGDSCVINPDTLNEPGSVSGFVELQPGDDPRTIFVLVIGSNYSTMAGSDGAFTLEDMAEGDYTVRFLSTLDDYDPLEVIISITAGAVNNLADTIVLPFNGVAIPTGVTIDYDTLKQIVTLSWNPIDTGIVKGYNVYRTLVGNSYPAEPLNGLVPVTDAVYGDSAGEYGVTYEYKITAINKQGDEGTKSSAVSIEVVAPLVFLRSFGSQGVGQEQFSGPTGITGDSSNIYVADFNLKKIEKYDLEGNYISGFSTDYKPFSIYLAQDNNMIVLARDPDLILKIEKTGAILDTFELHNDLNEPYDVDQDSEGNYYVTNRLSHKVLVYDINGTYIRSWGGLGTSDGLFNDAYGVAVDDFDYVYVTDGTNGRVQKFTTDGTFVLSWGSNGASIGQFQRPLDVTIDEDGFIWVLEVTGRRIQKFDSQGDAILRFGQASDEQGYFGQSLKKVWIDLDNNIWISESANTYRVQKFRER